MELETVVEYLSSAGLIDKKEFDEKVELYKQNAPTLKLAQDNASLLMLVAEKDLQLSITNQQLLEANEQQATLLMALAEKGVL
ncbi:MULTISPECIES: hypothetical protein [Bacillus cereus group]|uniref:hypothetical protein n=1 Tax=Bacillus cereus group TaxID=86661 RepID=UPI00119EDD0D|nr:hypothetical protein [Bacillus sp. FDAARGOS_235]HDR7367939.1 hypothetical protein [Bacillus toyonensis]